MRFKETTFRQRLGRLMMPFFMIYFRLHRGMTFGVRGAVLDGEGRVFLVKHTYVPGWYLPGGGVDPGETAEEALARELMEEGNIRLTGPAELQGLHLNREVSRRDHVAFYIVRAFEQTAPRGADDEIAACGFFPLDALPEDATAATRRRIDEIAGRRRPDGSW
ncbi:NUDIX domain-containing protein [Labrys wisconsinensis]|uniref:8-oxo-dGTP pyrophosphatase MutT (NUDIX family) n=1 Tax=Labrys wisconsinensis TaxID=425677 RepID=A0ABU0JH56_9HYPH|nr:8-oxo-dGTP pyrophosphatase MutT (NUDIX family) [Labrys wisconsinensis]